MYRAITWLALNRDISVHDEGAVTTLAEKAQIEVAPASKSDGRACDVLVEGKDITWETRLPEVDANVSVVSAYRGQDFTWRQGPIWTNIQNPDRLRWFVFRQLPLENETIILWARDDLFPDARENTVTP